MPGRFLFNEDAELSFEPSEGSGVHAWLVSFQQRCLFCPCADAQSGVVEAILTEAKINTASYSA